MSESIAVASRLQTQEELLERLSEKQQQTYEEMDIPSRFALLYFVAKNYFHFGQSEY